MGSFEEEYFSAQEKDMPKTLAPARRRMSKSIQTTQKGRILLIAESSRLNERIGPRRRAVVAPVRYLQSGLPNAGLRPDASKT